MGLSSLLHNSLGKEVLKSLTSFQRRDNEGVVSYNCLEEKRKKMARNTIFIAPEVVTRGLEVSKKRKKY